MSKLYIFGIGGTGSRVLRALTMLLAAGVECRLDTIVPIIIDPDLAAADLTRAVEAMKKYGAIREKLHFTTANSNRFFETHIQQFIPDFRLPLLNTDNATFENYMGVSTMSKTNKALVDMLFSKDNLASDMQIGFKGNPNIGSVVLNQFANTPEFNEFANTFQQGDRIFIVSSIFGGTGASGFPLLLKTLRSNKRIPNFSLINQASIGAVTVLPYFSVKQDENSKIDSTTFISKTKSALSYYERNISNNNSINTLYYVADNIHDQYDNHEGGQAQKNDAHFIELLAALAILDFIESDPVPGTVHKEYGIKTNYQEIIFDDLGPESQGLLMKPLTQFLLFSKYMKDKSSDSCRAQPWAKKRSFDHTFFSSSFCKDLKSFQDIFMQWLKEMETHDRKFTPFELKCDSRHVFDLIRNKKPRKIMTLATNYALFDDRLNAISPAGNEELQFVELFYKATESLIKDKFNLT
jgi:hypothetical protein